MSSIPAKLSEEQKVQIRVAWGQGAKQRELAQRFGVSQPLISKTVFGIPKMRVIHQRMCVDCGAPLRYKTRCESCNAAWKKLYSQQYNQEYYLKRKGEA